MAGRSIFATLTRYSPPPSYSLHISALILFYVFLKLTWLSSYFSVGKFRKAGGRERSLFRSFSSTTEVVYEDPSSNCAEEENGETGDDLKSRIFSLRLPKRSATNVLQKWVTDGRQVSISDLRHISKQLRNSRRFKHALEVSFSSFQSSLDFCLSPFCIFYFQVKIKGNYQ